MTRFFITLFLSGCFYCSYAGSETNDSTELASYMQQQLSYKQLRVSCKMLDSISDIAFYCSRMEFPMGDGSLIPTEYHFVKTNDTFKSVSSSEELICTPEFLASIHKDFRLTNMASALKFQEILDVVNSQNSMNSDRKIFQQENDWYFLRDEFFDDFVVFIVHVDKKGSIVSITYEREIEGLVIPDEAVRSNGHRAEWGYKIPSVAKQDSVSLRKHFDDVCHFHFEFSSLQSRLVEKVSKATFYKASIVFTEEEFSSATVFGLIKSDSVIKHGNSNRDLLQDEVFFNSLKKDFSIKSEDDALTLQEALDVIAPVGTFDVDDKELVSQENKWLFVRSESFGNKAAFIAETDGDGTITAFTYNNKAITKQ